MGDAPGSRTLQDMTPGGSRTIPAHDALGGQVANGGTHYTAYLIMGGGGGGGGGVGAGC